jgi:5-methylthioadenosine/S-adenosylhomocysteine deaminase
MDAQTIFAMATLNGAKTLGIDKEEGSIETGKKADRVLLDVGRVWNPYESSNMYSTIVYSCSAENVQSVIVDGKWLYKNKVHQTLDASSVTAKAGEELRLLQQRLS